MADVFEVINNRRSIREYKNEQIHDVEIERIINAGIMAPTARGEAPWHFTVVQNTDFLKDINNTVHNVLKDSGDEFLEAIAYSDKNVFHNAPTVVIVSVRSDATNMQADAAAAIENMLLAAEGLDIGACWLGLIAAYFEDAQNLKHLHIPEGYTPLYGVSLGYKAGEAPEAPQRSRDVVTWIR